MKTRIVTESPVMTPSTTHPFKCSGCGTYYSYPYQQVDCEKSHQANPSASTRPEKILLRLLAMVAPEHAEKAGEFGEEILEAIRK